MIKEREGGGRGGETKEKNSEVTRMCVLFRLIK